MNSIILSIKPKWASLIYAGKKEVEWRKSIPAAIVCGHSENGFVSILTTQVYMYETAPVSLVTGFFEMCCCTCFSDTKLIPKDYRDSGAVPIVDLDKYANKKAIYGWEIDAVTKFKEPKRLSDFTDWRGNKITRPPQSWMYHDFEDDKYY